MKSIFISLLLLIGAKSYSQHTLVLNNGDKINGVILSLLEDEWLMIVGGKEMTVHMKEVSSVFFKEYVPYDGVHIPDGKETSIEVNGFTVKYQILDRFFEREPKVSVGTEDRGTVVVKITVDRYGNIKTAEPGAPGSTTSNNYLYAKAKTAAKSAKFNEYLKGPIITEGTITIIY